jgi:glycosyltransferase involved in cell wall biosynthesis
MLAHNPKLNVELAKQFAWLLRKDVRAIYSSQSDPGFDEWWLIKGRQEFAGWADSAQPQALQALFVSNGTATVAGVTFHVPKVATLLAKHRPDALREFTQAGKVNNEKFFAWVVVRGLAEHRLLAHVPKTLLAALDQPLPKTLPQATDTDAPPGATLLMYLVWTMMDKATQESKNLFTPEGRKAFLPWFFGVVQPLGLGPLVAGRWRAWLQMSIPGAPTGPEIPRFSQMAWLTSEALRQQIKLDQPEDLSKLTQWAEKAIQANEPWSWLRGQQNQAAKPKAEAHQGKDKPFGLNIYGFAYGELGIGEDLRMAVECCEAAGIPYHVVNVDAGDTGQADLHLKDKVNALAKDELPPYNTNLFCLPAFDTVSRVFMPQGAAVFEGYRNIGWWPWEFAVFPKAWKPYAFELVDEVWASSQFLYDMYKQSTDKPVKLVPLAVSVARMQPYPRKHYGLPENKFLFLYIFDFNSSVARKNPMAAVQAFKLAFKSTDNAVGLVLKTMNTKASNPEWQAFLKECQSDPRIQLMTQTLDRPAVLGLINACDAYLSLHRAEGFGRTLAEAMLLSKPVIATGYSGNVDFMHPACAASVPFKLKLVDKNDYQWLMPEDTAVWADPDTQQAAIKMREVVQNYAHKPNMNNIALIADGLFNSSKQGAVIKKALINEGGFAHV